MSEMKLATERFEARSWRAHRIAGDLQVDHLCRHRQTHAERIA